MNAMRFPPLPLVGGITTCAQAVKYLDTILVLIRDCSVDSLKKPPVLISPARIADAPRKSPVSIRRALLWRWDEHGSRLARRARGTRWASRCRCARRDPYHRT